MSLLKQVKTVAEFPGVVAVNKPAGLVVHGDGRTDEQNLCDWVLENYPEIAGVGESIERDNKPDIARPGIVHRLDRETSGVMLIARSQESYEHLKQQFKKREIEKTYEAFVYDRVKNREFSVDDPIGRSSGKDFRKMAVSPYVRGKARKAQTDFELVRSGEKLSYVKAFPKTGRTHQIRVHLKSLHHPIICDGLYASSKDCFGIGRQALHAAQISFHVADGSSAVAAAGLPTDLRELKNEQFDG